MVSLIKAVISAGIGAGDIAIEEVTGDKEVVGPLTAKDVYRTVLCVGSLAGSLAGIEGRVGAEGYLDHVFYSSLPLFERSVYNIVKKKSKSSAGTTAAAELKLTPLEIKSPLKIETKKAEVTTPSELKVEVGAPLKIEEEKIKGKEEVEAEIY